MSESNAAQRPETPYELARRLADDGLDGPEILQQLVDAGVDVTSAKLLVEAVGAPMPEEEFDIERDVRTGVFMLSEEVRARLNRDTAKSAQSKVREFFRESIRFSADDQRQMVRRAMVGGGFFVAACAVVLTLVSYDVETFPAYVFSCIVGALGGAHLLYGLAHVEK
jgi:hypothetical protein